MSIADRINSIEEHLTNDYESLKKLGFYEEGTNKNIENIALTLDNFYNKVSNKIDLSQNGIIGRTSQETTTGKNKLNSLSNYSAGSTRTSNGVTYLFNSDGSISINGTATGTSFAILIGNNLNDYETERFIINEDYIVGNWDNSNITLMARGTDGIYRTVYKGNNSSTGVVDIKNIPLGVVYIEVASGSTVNETIYPQIELGNTRTSYEQYTGGIPSPNPDYPQEIKSLSDNLSYKVSGKNLLDITATSQTKNNVIFTVNNDKTILANGTANSTSNLSLGQVYLEANETYFISGCPTNGGSGKYRLELKNSGGSTQISDSGNGVVYTPNESGVYTLVLVYWYNWNFNNRLFKPMIEKNSVETSYEPYISESFPINLKSKNLFDYKNVNNLALGNGIIQESTNYRGYSVSNANGKTYTLSRKNISSNNRFRVAFTIEKPAENVVFYNTSGQQSSINADNLTEVTFTVPNTYNYVFIYLSNGGETIDDSLEIQLEDNLSKTLYEPYYDIKLNKIDSSIDVLKIGTGKNLFNGIFRQGDTYGNTAILNRIFDDSNCYLNANTTYTFSTNLDTSVYRYALNIKATPFPRGSDESLQYDSGWQTTSSFTVTPTVSGYLGVVISRVDNTNLTPTDIENIWFQLEKNYIVTEYEPYEQQFYIKQMNQDILLDGTNSNTSYDSNTHTLFYNTNNFVKNSDGGKIYSDHFLGTANGGSVNTNLNVWAGNSNTFAIRYAIINSKGEFDTWLSTNNTACLYMLSTPIYEIITEEKYPTLYNQLKDIQEYLVKYKIQNEFLLDYSSPNIEY